MSFCIFFAIIKVTLVTKEIMNKHLLITYSWSVNNIGDIGITPGLLNLINEEKPDLPVKVLAWQPEEDPDFQKIKTYLPKYKSNCDVYPMPFLNRIGENASPTGAWSAFVKRWGAHKIESFRKGCLTSYESEAMADDILNQLPLEIFDELKRDAPETADAIKNAGFILYNSGTTLNFGRLGVKNLWGYTLPLAMPLLIARVLKIPYGINSQSVDAVEWPMELIYQKLLPDARFVYCRDSDSLNYIHSKGLANKSSGYRPDSTFFFKGFDEEWADKFLLANKLEDKKFMSIMLRISDTKAILDDPTGGCVSEKRQLNHMQKMKELIEIWIKKSECRVLLCHETRGTLETAKKYLYDILSEEAKSQCVYMDSFWTSEQAYSVFKRSRIVTSMEMHSIIMTLNVGTPVIHNPFDECGRKKWMLNDIGLSDWLVDIDSESAANDMISKALDIHENYSLSERRIQKILPGLKVRAIETLNEVWSHWKTGGKCT
jgi:polysaccharide pyruvyl transferase WcaK-like protein